MLIQHRIIYILSLTLLLSLNSTQVLSAADALSTPAAGVHQSSPAHSHGVGKGSTVPTERSQVPLEGDVPPPFQGPDHSIEHGRHGFLSTFLLRIEAFFEHLYSGIMTLPTAIRSVPREIPLFLDRISDGKGMGHLVQMGFILAGLFGTGILCEYLFRRRTVFMFRHIGERNTHSRVDRLLTAGRKLGLEVVSLGLFTLTVLLFYLLFYSGQGESFRLILTAYLAAFLIVRVFSIVSNCLLAPNLPDLRPFPLSDTDAGYLHRWGLIVTSTAAFGWLTCGLMHLMMVPEEIHLLLVLGVGTVIFCIFFTLVYLRYRLHSKIPASYLQGINIPHSAAPERYLMALAYLGLIYLVWSLSLITGADKTIVPTVVSLLLLPLLIVVDKGLGQFLNTLLNPELPEQAGDETKHLPEAERLKKRILSQKRVLRRLSRIVLALFLGVAVSVIWDITLPLGVYMIRPLFNIVVTLILAYGTWELTRTAIDSRLGPEVQGGEGEDEEEWGRATRTRTETLLPLLKKSIGTVMLILVVLIVLSSMGVDIAPLMAGAGVVGLAIGFGAQKLVRDIFSGIFFLLDDAFRVGEYVDAGNVSGTVEEITLRTIKLRHHRGMLQIVPLGDLASVTNYMRGGIVVKFNLSLPYDTDIEKVRKIIKKVGRAMLNDEELGPDILKPVKSQGIRSVGDSVMTVRIKFTARPGAHFLIRREAFKRITAALTAKGIHYAHRKVIVDFEPGKQEGEASPHIITEKDRRKAAGGAVEEALGRDRETNNEKRLE